MYEIRNDSFQSVFPVEEGFVKPPMEERSL